VVVPDVLSGHDNRDSRRVGLTPTATVRTTFVDRILHTRVTAGTIHHGGGDVIRGISA